MDSTKNFFTNFFMVLGILFVIILILLTVLFIADPYNLKPMFFGTSGTAQTTAKPVAPVTTDTTTASTSDTPVPVTTDTTFTLSAAQKQALVGLGIDPNSVPETVTAEQALCFEGKLGAPRVAEIRAGSVPSTFELIKVKSCVGQ
jgi:hypothetical protein